MRREAIGGAVAARLAGALLQLASLAALARLLGAEALGTAITYVAVTRLAGTVCSLGLPYWLIRELPRLDEPADQQRTAAQAAVVAAAATLVVGAIIAVVVWSSSELGATAVLLGLAGAVAVAMGRVASGALKGVGEGAASLALEFALPAVVTLGGVTALAASVDDVTGTMVLVVLVAGSTLSTALLGHRAALVAGARAWARGGSQLPPRRDWLPFGASGMLGAALVDVPPLVVGATLDVTAAGMIGAAQRMLSLPTLVIVGVATMYAPRFSRAWHTGATSELRRLFRSSQRCIAVPLVPVLLLALAAPGLVLLPFGDAVEAGAHDVVRILGLAQLVNVLTGLGPELLLMTARARSEMRWTAVALAVSVAACVITVLLDAGLVGFGMALGLGVAVRAAGCFFRVEEVMHPVRTRAVHG